MTKHTPGPWKIAEQKPSSDLSGHLWILGNKKGWNEYPIGELIPYNTTEAVSNAHLIAVAPELLEACKILTGFCGNEAFDRAVKEAQQIIIKAEGG